jgi:gallate decarboxylase subunit D
MDFAGKSTQKKKSVIMMALRRCLVKENGRDTFRITEKRDRLEVHGCVNFMGSDLEVNLLGGEPHIGAVGIGEPRPSLGDPAGTGATASVFTFLSHKEDEIAKPMAQELARRLNRKVVVVAGMHWQGLGTGEIETVMALCRTITERIVAEVGKG